MNSPASAENAPGFASALGSMVDGAKTVIKFFADTAPESISDIPRKKRSAFAPAIQDGRVAKLREQNLKQEESLREQIRLAESQTEIEAVQLKLRNAIVDAGNQRLSKDQNIRIQRDRPFIRKILMPCGMAALLHAMRQARLKAPPDHPAAYYHCVSRVVDRQFVFGEEEKEMFVKLMWRWEKFCQVRVITFCVMSNHFHLLVEVKPRPAQAPGDEELLKHLGGIYGALTIKILREQMDLLRQGGSGKALAELRESFLRRMWDISAFMKTLKQQFTQWFNGRHGRKGTLWEERFKSVLVEGAGEALATMSAYIDLNPVRAGLCDDPKDYRWCGYAAAVVGNRRARRGLGTVIEALNRPGESVRQVLAEYRVQLFGRGEQAGSDDPERGVKVRRGFATEAVERVVAQRGKLTRWEMLRCRVRYFADGAVLGSREFVNAVFQAERHRFGPKRKDGARRMRFIEADSLRVLRDLRVGPVG